MSDYRAPVEDMRFVLEEIVGLQELAALPAFDGLTPDLADAILEGAARFTADVVAPLNRQGDVQGCTWSPAGVTTPAGWLTAYQQFCAAGWGGITLPTAYGGQGLPEALGLAVREMVCSASMAFSLGPLLTAGAVEALLTCASDELKTTYLHKMVSGEWTGTMNLTEPQAGSDLALIRTRAEPHPDGSYRLFGQKIFITYGEHDLTGNIIHLVLARLPGAPAGVKGISLFLVPKFLVNADGSLGARNDVHCVALEHKLGIHASPTCVMAYGDQGGAVGYLLGEPHRGLQYMFVMMNAARLGVGLQGVAIAERACQQALGYAQTRQQGRDAVTGAALVTIDHHPDVRRMLMHMQVRTEASRALAFYTAGLLDRARALPSAEQRQHALYLAEFLIPVVKAGATEMGVEVASLGVQVHGGMGYIEGTGAAQHLRDARIATIYEGTTGIQANDLLLRKLLRDQGATAQVLGQEVAAAVQRLSASGQAALQALGRRLEQALAVWTQASEHLQARTQADMGGALFAAVPYLQLTVGLCEGWMVALSALAAERHVSHGTKNAGFYRAKQANARFFADHLLPVAMARAEAVLADGQ